MVTSEDVEIIEVATEQEKLCSEKENPSTLMRPLEVILLERMERLKEMTLRRHPKRLNTKKVAQRVSNAKTKFFQRITQLET